MELGVSYDLSLSELLTNRALNLAIFWIIVNIKTQITEKALVWASIKHLILQRVVT